MNAIMAANPSRPEYVSQFSTPNPSNGTAPTPGSNIRSTPDGTPGDTPKARKARVTLTEEDKLKLMQECVKRKEDYKEGNRMNFWQAVREAMKDLTGGKELSSPKHPVDALVRERRFFVRTGQDLQERWPNEPLAKLTDEWIDHINMIAEAEAADRALKPPTRTDVQKRRQEEMDREIESHSIQFPTEPPSKRPQYDTPGAAPRSKSHAQGVENENVINLLNNYLDESDDGSNRRVQPVDVSQQSAETIQRVVVEGALSKQDWMDIMLQVRPSDTKINALEAKLDSLLETTKRTHQMLVQLLKNQAKRPGSVGSEAQLNGDIPGVGQAVAP